jgi:two-component system, NtrC family, response regulator AtoC
MGCAIIPKPVTPTWFRDLPPEEVIFGSSPTMEEIRRKVEKAASTDIPVLLQGETGTGKEVLARFLHGRSRWGRGCFVQVNCPAVPGALIESELFGHEKGAFTGAFETKPGRIELARGGTLFLDEIAELDFGLQAKLLQLLQDGQFLRIGAQEERHLDARVVCATNRQLQREIKSGTFRRDLYYRISVMSMELPRLEERSGDIPMLVAYFLEKHSKKYGCAGPPFSNSLLRRLQQYRWPGNIRELESLVKRYVILGSEQGIADNLQSDGDQDHLRTEIPPEGVIPLKKVTQEAVKQVERKIIRQVLETNGWHRGLAARALKISYGALLYKMKEAGLLQKRRAAGPDDGSATVPSWAETDVGAIKVRPPVRSRSRITGSNLRLTGD